MDTTYTVWMCGVIDRRYDECLYGTTHLAREGENRTLCGKPAHSRSGKVTAWWVDVERTHDPEWATCKRCRKVAGLEIPVGHKSLEML